MKGDILKIVIEFVMVNDMQIIDMIGLWKEKM